MQESSDSAVENQVALVDQTHHDLGVNKSFIGTKYDFPEHTLRITAEISTILKDIDQKAQQIQSLSYNFINLIADDTENIVPGLITGQQNRVGEDYDSDEEDGEQDNEFVRRLFRPKPPPYIKADFDLCNACYRTSKEYGYSHIGISRRKSLTTALLDKLWEPVSCCVLGAIIDYAWKFDQSITEPTNAIMVPTYTPEKHIFGPKIADILILSDNLILSKLSALLKNNFNYESIQDEGINRSTYKDILGNYIKRQTKKAEKYNQNSSNATLKTINEISLMRDLSSSQVDMSLLQSWFYACERHHHSCTGQQGNKNLNHFSLLLVDVKERRLVEASPSSRYLALSYVWGGTSQYKTTTGALSALKSENSLNKVEDQIPQCIKDAIEVVAMLGERYLWVDALCITHDDEKQKHHQIAQMSSIYHQAALTIVSLGGKDAGTGLPGLQPYSRHQNGLQVAPGIRLCQRTRKLSDLLSKSVYETRAWTYQERLLSRRCIFFTEEQVYFQCGTQVHCEDRIEALSHEHNLVAPLGFTSPLEMSTTLKLLQNAFPYYHHFVVDYSRKQLSYQSDIINAFSGITTMLELRYNWKFLCGLPIQFIDLALLWASSSIEPISDVNLQRRSNFPSWSWAGWCGGVDYELVPSNGLKSELDSVYIENKVGCYKMSARVSEFSKFGSCSQSGHEFSDSFEPSDDFPEFWENAKIVHFRAYTVPAKKFEFKAANSHHYFTKGHIFQGVSYQQTALILDSHGNHCGTLYGINLDTIKNSSRSDLQLVLLSANLRRSRSLYYADPDLTIQQHGLRPDGSGRLGQYEGKIYDQDYHDTKKLSKTESRWSILNILLVSVEDNTSERLAIGQIHVMAWKSMDPVQSHVALI